MAFSDWLSTQLRSRPDLNQARVAEYCGIYASTVRYWLKGRSLPENEQVPKLAKLFSVDEETVYLAMGRAVPTHIGDIAPLADELEIFRDLEALRGERNYGVTVAALKAVLEVAKKDADAPAQG